jgi:N-methylhydantoinase A/oxoprolinase/acetone carboxylase beta subunit
MLDGALRAERPVLTKEQGWVVCKLYDRNRLPIDPSNPGPALVEETPTTTLVLPDQNFACDETGQLIISEFG